MQAGEKKTFMYIPSLGIVESFKTRDEAVNENNPEQAAQKIFDDTVLRRLQKEYPGCRIIQNGNSWAIIPTEPT
ncbi:hypothetical protein QNH39_26135 [Neobacillus novalis]|uniref:Uncharacterized protein n=1 Tax=Neobacillus novalis TaxID=220687 RepID=A0AA95MMN7_9BACI|nr:hypothetical protein [Neobacillus novalis]WHY86012.1 hypothetical protein QNH39_26135 [Neobacillus novalis]